MSVRVYVPGTLAMLAEVVGSGGVGPSPVLAHAVTEELRSAHPGADDEELEYAAMSAAAQDSVGLLSADEVPRRVVIAVDAPRATPRDGGDLSAVEVDAVLPLRLVAAVHVDAADAEQDVAAGRDAWAAAELGDQEAARAVERCLDHELGWFATQEIGDLLAR